jgi:hypothetical protein
MSGLTYVVQWIWAFSVAAQVAVCATLLFRGRFRKLPVFTAYISLNLCQAGFLYVVYAHFGFSSHTAEVLAWWSEVSTLILRSLATAEVLRLALGPYRGIWGLGWRVLAVAFGGVFSYAAIEAGRNIAWFLVLAERGLNFAFAVALVACLLLVRHYMVPVRPTYKALLAGFCFYSCTVVLASMAAQTFILRGFAHYQPIWQAATTLSFAIVQVVWAVALRKPLPVEENQHVLLPASIYQQLSPEINQRLRALNEQLIQFWKPEATRQ